MICIFCLYFIDLYISRAAVICMFFTNELLRQQTAEDETDAVLRVMETNIDRAIQFQDQLFCVSGRENCI